MEEKNWAKNVILKNFFKFYEIYYCRFLKSVLNYICIHELVYNVNSSTQEAVFLINVGIQLFDCLEFFLGCSIIRHFAIYLEYKKYYYIDERLLKYSILMSRKMPYDHFDFDHTAFFISHKLYNDVS